MEKTLPEKITLWYDDGLPKPEHFDLINTEVLTEFLEVTDRLATFYYHPILTEGELLCPCGASALEEILHNDFCVLADYQRMRKKIRP